MTCPYCERGEEPIPLEHWTTGRYWFHKGEDGKWDVVCAARMPEQLRKVTA